MQHASAENKKAAQGGFSLNLIFLAHDAQIVADYYFRSLLAFEMTAVSTSAAFLCATVP
jgi:hypothetical protein